MTTLVTFMLRVIVSVEDEPQPDADDMEVSRAEELVRQRLSQPVAGEEQVRGLEFLMATKTTATSSPTAWYEGRLVYDVSSVVINTGSMEPDVLAQAGYEAIGEE